MMDSRIFHFGINHWLPFWATGIRVRSVSRDYRHIVVDLRMGLFNRNYVGTHFGGSMFAMSDPFYMLMYMNVLGKRYLVWDHSAAIKFIKPGRGTITAEYHISDEDLSEVKVKTAGGDKYLKEYDVEIRDEKGEVVASVKKVVYFRLKRDHRPPPPPSSSVTQAGQ